MTITNEMIKAAALAYSKSSGSVAEHFRAALEAAEKVRPDHMSEVTKMVVADQKQPIPVDKAACGAQVDGKALTPAKHTPLPWGIDPELGIICSGGAWPSGTGVASCTSDSNVGMASAKINAAYIVEACNSYPELKAHIEELERILCRFHNCTMMILSDNKIIPDIEFQTAQSGEEFNYMDVISKVKDALKDYEERVLKARADLAKKEGVE